MGLVSLTLCATIVVVFHFQKQLLSDTGALSTSIDAFQLLGPIICHLIIILESLFAADAMARMWKSVAEMDELIAMEDQNKMNLRFLRSYSFKLAASQLIPLAVEVGITASISKAEEWQRHWMTRLFSFTASRLAAMHYILWADYLTSRAEYLAVELEDLGRDVGRVRTDFDVYLFVGLKRIKKLHRIVWQLTKQVNGRFKWFILSSVGNYFLSIVIDLYWIYGNFRFGGNPFALRE